MGDLLPDGGTWGTGLPPAEGWRKLAYVFQSPSGAVANALGNVILGMELRFEGMAKAEMREKAKDLLSLVGLGNDMEKYPAVLSGERQRVAIARALSVDPEIILMDEPFSALDLNTRRRMRAEILRIWEQTGKTVIFVTRCRRSPGAG